MRPTKPRKLQRVTQACDFCHRRSIKCAFSAEDNRRCQNCVDFALDCTYDRPTKRRGVRRKSTQGRVNGLVTSPASTNDGGPSHRRNGTAGTFGATPETEEDEVVAPTRETRWTARMVASHSVITGLVDIYFEVVYPIYHAIFEWLAECPDPATVLAVVADFAPISKAVVHLFPLFHRPTLLQRLNDLEYRENRPFFAALMALCALASARARDGALFSNRFDPSRFSEPPSEAFYAAAKDTIPKDLVMGQHFDYLRASALLAVTCIQYGDIKAMHQYLGIYHTWIIMRRLYDETNWDEGLGIVALEERRRVYWSIYTLEVYSSVVWGGVIRCREAHSRVQYPTEIDDEYISNEGYDFGSALPSTSVNQGFTNSAEGREVSWLKGWNFTTDLYRIIEHATDQFRTRRLQNRPIYPVARLFGEWAPPGSPVMEYVNQMFDQLPDVFKSTLPVTMDSTKDRYSFQAANITATLQLVQMLLFEPDEANIEQKCDVASRLLRMFSRIPVEYLRAISSPLLHHLAGIGSILGSVIERPISEHSYLLVRTILLAMADLLESLESGMHNASPASESLKKHINRIDEYMAKHRSTQVANRPEMNNLKIETLEQQNLGATNFHFQLPEEILQDWPWPFYSAQSNDLLPLKFDWDFSIV